MDVAVAERLGSIREIRSHPGADDHRPEECAGKRGCFYGPHFLTSTDEFAPLRGVLCQGKCKKRDEETFRMRNELYG